jgi:hypothetical protein
MNYKEKIGFKIRIGCLKQYTREQAPLSPKSDPTRYGKQID